MIATDIAARGIDIEDITHVINYELPNVPESYVHRIGRTARAGAKGQALAFCDSEERSYLRDIERTTKKKIPVVEAPAIVQVAPVAVDLEKYEEPKHQHGHRQGRSEQRPRKEGGPRQKQFGQQRGQRPSRPQQGQAHRRPNYDEQQPSGYFDDEVSPGHDPQLDQERLEDTRYNREQPPLPDGPPRHKRPRFVHPFKGTSARSDSSGGTFRKKHRGSKGRKGGGGGKGGGGRGPRGDDSFGNR